MRGWDLFMCACQLAVGVKRPPQDGTAPHATSGMTSAHEGAPDPGTEMIRRRMEAHARGETLRGIDVSRPTSTEEAMGFMQALQ